MVWPTTSPNDPIFYPHHSKVDQILESWFYMFTRGSSNLALLPEYIPVSGGHPGHNRNDYMVPFFPLVTPIELLCTSEELGYTYDKLIPATMKDYDVPDCSEVIPSGTCPICDANGTCIDCTSETCPAPDLVMISLEASSAGDPLSKLELGVGLGLGLPLLIALTTIVILALLLIIHICISTSGTQFHTERSSMKQ